MVTSREGVYVTFDSAYAAIYGGGLIPLELQDPAHGHRARSFDGSPLEARSKLENLELGRYGGHGLWLHRLRLGFLCDNAHSRGARSAARICSRVVIAFFRVAFVSIVSSSL